jgi:SAM-dependent methyltransferase
MISDFRIEKNDLVIEIASNDGYLLQFFKTEGVNVLGIEPAKSVAQVAKSKGVETLIEFFGADLARELKSKEISPKLIVANNVLAHVPDIHDFIQGVSILLDSNGIATFEFPHLSNLIEFNQFDTIYHEHYSYLSLEALKPIFIEHGLEIFQVETLTTHGGSLRIFVAPEGSRKINEKEINDIQVRELTCSPRSPRILQSLRMRALETKFNLLNELISLKKAGLTVAGYGAAAKGNTLLNYCGIDSDLISYVVDKNPAKQGKYLPGAHIPVYSESAFKTFPPNVVIIFPWNLKEEIKSQLEGQLGSDVKFMVTTPEVEFI